MPKFDYVLFDVDHTIMDFDAAEELALKDTFAAHGIHYDEAVKQQYLKINDRLWDEYEKSLIEFQLVKERRFGELFASLGIDCDGYKFNDEYLLNLAKYPLLIDGAYEACSELKKVCRLAIVTNGMTLAQYKRLEASKLNGLFDKIFVSEEVGFKKPQAEFFDHVVKALGIEDRSRSVIVGDSLSTDMRGGSNSGIKTCWYNPELKANPYGDIRIDFEISKLSELPKILL